MGIKVVLMNIDLLVNNESVCMILLNGGSSFLLGRDRPLTCMLNY